jgi:hypothetical protein
MIRRHVLFLIGGLLLGPALVIFGPLGLTQAQEPVPQGGGGSSHWLSGVHVDRRGPIDPSAGRVVIHAVGIEPIRFQSAERLSVEANTPFTLSGFPRAQVIERYHAIQLVQRQAGALTGLGFGLARAIAGPSSTYESSDGVIRPAAVCVVDSTADSGPGTLRRCLENAGVGDIITFDAGVFPPTSPATISLSSELPRIITASLTIDGSEAGVILDGDALSDGHGLVVLGTDGVRIQGLQIVHFPQIGIVVADGATNTVIGGDRFTGRGPLGQGNLVSGNGTVGVWIQDAGTLSNTVLGNYIGTDVSGTAAHGNAYVGVLVREGASSNVIGGDTPGARNVISGNGYDGIWIEHLGTAGNYVLGNYVGTDASGTTLLPNDRAGVIIGFGATDNVIGGDIPGARNLISGNGYMGIVIQNTGTTGNHICGNLIGTDVSGTTAVPNHSGVFIAGAAAGNTIGGDTAESGNLISGNVQAGVQIQDEGTTNNDLIGNYIGTDISGTAALPNYVGVLVLSQATDNTIGEGAFSARNLISGNAYAGVFIQDEGTSGNQVLGNFIGTNISGTDAISNGQFGVSIVHGATDNVVGGDTAGAGNLISGNGDIGVKIENSGTMSNIVRGNYIGTDVSGTAFLGNAQLGVVIHDGATNNIIGGESSGARNLISGNGQVGVLIEDAGTSANQVLGNYIGTDVSGTAFLGNTELGVVVHDGATNNTIGGDTRGAGNLISGNGLVGVLIEDAGTSENQVLGNYIGTDVSGSAPLGNARAGILIKTEATSNTIGGDASGARNLISGNGQIGVWIEGAGTSGNRVLGNYIGTDVSGTVSLGNAEQGVVIHDGATNNTIGGDTSEARNVISGNGQAGIWIEDVGTSGNRVLGNVIGTDVSGTVSLGNEGFGVCIAFGAMDNTVGVSNTIVFNASAGVVVSGTNTLCNTVTRNVIHDNGGLPIDLVSVPIPMSPRPPDLRGFSSLTNTVWGTACPGCCVEIYANLTAAPAGTVFLGDVRADEEGYLNLSLADVPPYPYLAATATDLDGTTSEFSAGFFWPDVPWHRIYLPIVTRNGWRVW